MRLSLALVAALLLALQLPVHAQEKKDPGLYKVEFNIRDGAATAAGQRYTLLMEPNRKAVLKVGSRVPVATGSYQGNTANPAVNTQYTYVDIGVDIECIVGESNGKIALHGSIDISSVMAHGGAGGGANPPNPTVGQTKLELDTALDPGKPATVASIEDGSNARHFQVEATVTRVD
jgi:hypothetical protein